MWIKAEATANGTAAPRGRPVSASTAAPPRVDAIPIRANAAIRSSRYLAMAFQIACSAPAPITIRTIGTVIWECDTDGSFCLTRFRACQ
jgi:hypothetical protein